MARSKVKRDYYYEDFEGALREEKPYDLNKCISIKCQRGGIKRDDIIISENTSKSGDAMFRFSISKKIADTKLNSERYRPAFTEDGKRLYFLETGDTIKVTRHKEGSTRVYIRTGTVENKKALKMFYDYLGSHTLKYDSYHEAYYIERKPT